MSRPLRRSHFDHSAQFCCGPWPSSPVVAFVRGFWRSWWRRAGVAWPTGTATPRELATPKTSPRRSTGSRVIRQHKVAAGVTGGDEGTEVDRLRLASWPPSRRSPRRADGGRTRPPADLAMQASHPRRATPALRERGYATEETGLRRSEQVQNKSKTTSPRQQVQDGLQKQVQNKSKTVYRLQSHSAAQGSRRRDRRR